MRSCEAGIEAHSIRKGRKTMASEKLLSVGIDVGTSTTSLIFSHLTIENRAGFFSVPSVEITDKEVIYQSPVYRTPLVDSSLIDGSALCRIIEKEYGHAGVNASQVKSGAVIITGESARKENASMVLEELSGFAGDFVVSTAGPDLESVIAGQGSGAQQYSRVHNVPVVNLDIGGGTTNVVLLDGDEVLARGCLDIGGRQVTVDDRGRITYISPSAGRIEAACGLSLKVGDTADQRKLERLCDGMCQVIEQLLGSVPETELLESIRTRGAQVFERPSGRPIRYLCFSGGVADCVYHPGREPFAYGDIGVLLAAAIRRSGMFQKYRVIQADETIRATVIGAGSYTTTISGSTVDYSENLFPRKNVPVLKLTAAEEERLWQGDEGFVREKAGWFLKQTQASEMVLAIHGKRNPDYEELKCLAEAIGGGLHPVLEPGAPLMVILRLDIAKALGQLLKRKLHGARPVLSLDGIIVEQNNFVDFGSPVMNGLVVPVVVKTLVFDGA